MQAAAHFMHLQQAQMQQAAAFQLQMQAAAAANWTSGSKPYMANVPAVWPMNVGVHPYNHPWPAAGFHQCALMLSISLSVEFSASHLC